MLILSVILFLVQTVQSKSDKQVVIFGDNYSVNGVPRNLTLSGKTYSHLFSENILWTHYLAQLGFGHNVLNYAVGGSTMLDMIDNCPSAKQEFGLTEEVCEEISQGIMPQIEQYLNETEGNRTASDIMVLIFFSGNDYILAQKTKEYVREIPMAMAEQVELAIQTLLEAGITRIRLATLPPLQWAPYLHRNVTYQTAVVQYLFESNAPIIFMSRKYQDQGVELINVEEFLSGVIFRMRQSGVDIDVTCEDDNEGVCKNDLRYYWLDELNPTSHIHHELATWMVTKLV